MKGRKKLKVQVAKSMPMVGAIEVLTMKPEDTLVVSVPSSTTKSDLHHMRNNLMKLLGTDKVLVVSDSVKLTLLTVEDINKGVVVDMKDKVKEYKFNEDYKFSDDTTHVAEILARIKSNDGYCPCELLKNEDTKCRCKSMKENLECKCGLYVKVNK